MNINGKTLRTIASVGVLLALLASPMVPCRAAERVKDKQPSSANDTNIEVSSGTLKIVVIRGSFAKWPHKKHYKDWRVSIIRPSDYARDESAKDKEVTFPVSADGSFRIEIHDVPVGNGYYLDSNAGSQRFGIFSDKIFIDVIGPESAG